MIATTKHPKKNKGSEKFSNSLRMLIKYHSITFRELSKAIGITHPHLVRLSNGKSCCPSLETLKKLSDFFNVSISQLLGEQKIDFEKRSKKLDLHCIEK